MYTPPPGPPLGVYTSTEELRTRGRGTPQEGTTALVTLEGGGRPRRASLVGSLTTSGPGEGRQENRAPAFRGNQSLTIQPWEGQTTPVWPPMAQEGGKPGDKVQQNHDSSDARRGRLHGS